MFIVVTLGKPARTLFLLDEDAGIDGYHVILVSQQGVDIYLLDFRSEAQQRGETDNDLRILTLVDTLLTTRTLQNLVTPE